MADDAPDVSGHVRHMAGPVRPQWGELVAVVRAVLAAGGTLEDVLAAADEVAVEEDLDPRRAADRAGALWSDEQGESGDD